MTCFALRWRAPRALVLVITLASSAAAGSAFSADTPSSSIEDEAEYQQARARIAARDYGGAAPFVAKLVEEYPDNADALSLMGFVLRKTQRKNEALPYYGKALARDPNHLAANEYLGELYAELGKLDLAKERLAVLEAACGKSCEQTRDVAEAIRRAEGR